MAQTFTGRKRVRKFFGKIEEVAEMLRVPVSWVYERTRRRTADRIPRFRVRKYWGFVEGYGG